MESQDLSMHVPFEKIQLGSNLQAAESLATILQLLAVLHCPSIQ
jgi:hypothetical protein